MKEAHPMPHAGPSHSALALRSTLHCLTGCAIGEVVGMALGTALGWSNASTVVVSTALAFLSGYALTMRPLLAAGIPLARAGTLALASDTLSIAIMEVVDNALMLVIPGAMNSAIHTLLFWGSLLASLVLAGVAAYPANRWLVARGRGHGSHGGHEVNPHGRAHPPDTP